MVVNDEKNAVLVLENGSVYFGYSHGAQTRTCGEICFNTGMTGYQEIFTDPSYYGQTIVMTNVHLGNYGALDLETESNNSSIRGVVCRNYSNSHSRRLANESLESFLVSRGIPCISGIDTRKLVREIRSEGAMNCVISTIDTSIPACRELLIQTPSMAGLELSSSVSTKEVYFVGNDKSPIRVAVIDFGIKKSILQNLALRNIYLCVFPMDTSWDRIMEFQPDGFFLSNGPGDPSVMGSSVELVQKIVSLGRPIFGICLGHQLLALAHGIPTYKMDKGHRGLNQPVLNLQTGRAEITSQNHGFSVVDSAHWTNELVEVTHKNLNDDTVEGIRIMGRPFFSVQYHPEASPGPHDSRYLFDHFFELLVKHKN